MGPEHNLQGRALCRRVQDSVYYAFATGATEGTGGEGLKALHRCGDLKLSFITACRQTVALLLRQSMYNFYFLFLG